LSRYFDQEIAKAPFRFRVKLPPVTTSLTTQRWGNPVRSALPKDTTSELAGQS